MRRSKPTESFTIGSGGGDGGGGGEGGGTHSLRIAVAVNKLYTNTAQYVRRMCKILSP